MVSVSSYVGLTLSLAFLHCSPGVLKAEMLQSGGSEKRLKELLTEVESQFSDVALPRLSGKAGEQGKATLMDGREVLMKKLSSRPPIFEVENFLTHKECDHLIDLARQYGLKESKTLDDNEEMDTDRVVEMNKFDLWDKDRNGSIEIKEIHYIFEQLLDFDCEDPDILAIIGAVELDLNGDGAVSMSEFQSFNFSRLNALSLVRQINKIKAEKPTTKGRFSEQTFLSDFQDPLLEKLRERLSYFTGLPKDLIDASEDLQVVRYIPGGHYNCHLDSEEIFQSMSKCCHLAEFSGPYHAQCQLCRYMTVLYFLNDVREGGETAFPLADNATLDKELWTEDGDGLCNLARNCHKSNLVVKPGKGKAVIWYNHLLRKESGWLGQVDYRSFHGGCNVLKGEKWIANNWINASPIKMEDLRLWASDRYANEMKKKSKEADIEKEKPRPQQTDRGNEGGIKNELESSARVEDSVLKRESRSEL